MADEKYVISGDWIDTEWQAAAVGRNVPDLAQERNRMIFARGPRTHPFGLLAHTVVVNGEPRTYPSKDSAIADGAIPAPQKEEAPVPEAASAE